MPWILLALAMVYAFLNGFHDSAGLTATVIASRTLPPRLALLVAAAGEFIGPFLFGTAVAAAVGRNLLAPGAATMPVLYAALGTAIAWSLLTWRLGLPSSSSHALIGGLIGAALASAGWGAVQTNGAALVLLSLLLSPALGLAAGFLLMRAMLWLCRSATPAVNRFFRAGQVATSAILALSHSGNDAQKTMGVIALGLAAAHVQEGFSVPGWAVLASAAALAAGSAVGAERLIRALGGRVMTVRPIHGFAAQLSGAAVILGAALLGGPVSGTQVLGSALMGVGGAERLSRVRWEVGHDMLSAWLLTVPVCAIVAAVAVKLLG